MLLIPSSQHKRGDTLISRRTALLLLTALLLSAAMGWVVQTRKSRCAETSQTFSRRAPIPGASGRDTFFCSAMYQGMPAIDIAISIAWMFSVLAVFRSIWIDLHLWRLRRRTQWLR